MSLFAPYPDTLEPWPVGSETVRVREPIPSCSKIVDGWITIGAETGWVEYITPWGERCRARVRYPPKLYPIRGVTKFYTEEDGTT